MYFPFLNIFAGMNQAHLLLGGNIGDRLSTLQKAFSLVEIQIGKIIKHSAIYETAAWGQTDQPNFLNQAILVETALTPPKLLTQIISIELALGRERNEHQWAARTIDIDILLYGPLILRTDFLEIPHPRLPERKFALIPLAEIDQDVKHPVSRKTIATLNELCTDTLQVWRYQT